MMQKQYFSRLEPCVPIHRGQDGLVGVGFERIGRIATQACQAIGQSDVASNSA
tara:strand:+ start:1119 stop:1277 length:159 start_codon:yes stop_codon:yes gene_type:complete